MMRFKVGDLLAEDAEALVNTVNCVGVMGRGIALQFKKAFPGNFRAYADACERDIRSVAVPPLGSGLGGLELGSRARRARVAG